MKKNVFITGAAGFIGFHLSQSLEARGDHVLGYDNYNSYYDPSLKRERAAQLAKRGISIIEQDLCDFESLRRSVERHETTHLVHLAAQAGVRYSLENPHAYLKSNMDGFLNVLEICRQFPSIKLIYASSSSVYGLNQKTPFSVDDRTDQQASFYGVTKKANELMAHTYHHLFGIHATGLRFFTVYGPWGRPDMAYFSFTKAILNGYPIDIYNEGHLFRDFTYIDDIIEGMTSAIDHGFAYELFNLGNHRPEKVLYLIELLEKELGCQAKKNWLPMQPGDVLSTYADITYSTAKLGFIPKVSLEEGINHFVRWYKEYFRVYSS